MKQAQTSSPSLVKDKGFMFLLLAGILTAVLWNVPYGNYILYPFTILGTWFHEMGHGLTAILMGGSFSKLEIYSNGGGTAFWSHTDLWLGNRLGRAIVALGGLMGPPIVGSLFIFAGRKPKTSSLALNILAGLMVISLVIWIRSIYGLLVIGGLAIVFVAIAQKGSLNFKQFTIQFIGVAAIMDTYHQLDYLFIGEFVRDGQTMVSDTGQIANQLLLPYWFWGGLIALFSAFMLGYSLWKSYR
ncbi:MAG: M50 family metallopeptidase [Bacteroidota bacterium]